MQDDLLNEMTEGRVDVVLLQVLLNILVGLDLLLLVHAVTNINQTMSYSIMNKLQKAQLTPSMPPLGYFKQASHRIYTFIQH